MTSLIYNIYVTNVKSCDGITMQSTSRQLVTQRKVERYTLVVEVEKVELLCILSHYISP
jgi:hypothetical protein